MRFTYMCSIIQVMGFMFIIQLGIYDSHVSVGFLHEMEYREASDCTAHIKHN